MLRLFLCCSISSSSENVEILFPKIKHFFLSTTSVDEQLCYELIICLIELLQQANDTASDVIKNNFDSKLAERIVGLLLTPSPNVVRAAAQCLSVLTSEDECWIFDVLQDTSIIKTTHILLQNSNQSTPIEAFEYLENIFRSSSRLLNDFIYNKEVLITLLEIVADRKEDFIESLDCLAILFANTESNGIEEFIEENMEIIDLFLAVIDENIAEPVLLLVAYLVKNLLKIGDDMRELSYQGRNPVKERISENEALIDQLDASQAHRSLNVRKEFEKIIKHYFQVNSDDWD